MRSSRHSNLLGSLELLFPKLTSITKCIKLCPNLTHVSCPIESSGPDFEFVEFNGTTCMSKEISRVQPCELV